MKGLSVVPAHFLPPEVLIKNKNKIVSDKKLGTPVYSTVRRGPVLGIFKDKEG